MRIKRYGLTALMLVLSLLAITVNSSVDARQVALRESKDTSALYVVDFLDFAGGAAVAAQGTQSLQQYVIDTRKDAGIIRCEPLVQLGRTNHLMIIEVWQNRAAFENHESADHTKTFRANIQSKLGAPFDQRLHVLLQ